MLLSESYKNRLLELAGIELLSEADQKDIIINKIGLSPELADWAIGLNEKISVWIANQVKKFNLDKTNESDFRDILDWVKGSQGAVNIKTHDFESAKKAAKEWHDQNFKVNNDLVLKDKKIILQTGPYYWVQLKTVEDCVEEGEAMGHCIGGEEHSGPISRGDHLAFSMRDNKNKPHITLEIDRKKNIIEFKGKQNDAPIPSYMNHGVEFLNQKQDIWNDISDSTFWKGLDENSLFDFAELLMSVKKNISDYHFMQLLHNAKDTDKMMDILFKYKGDDLSRPNIKLLMQIAKNKDQVAKIILNYRKENNQKLDDNSVNEIISSVRNVDAIANIIIDLLGYDLSEFNIEDLLEFTNNKQKIVKSILKYVPKEKINAIIEQFGIETKLIPESRSVRNFRKTIRQLIKENHKQ